MEKISVKINIIRNDLDVQVKPSELDNVIFAEHSDELHTVSQIVLFGKYNKTYSVLSYFITLHDETVLVDGDRLFMIGTALAISIMKRANLRQNIIPNMI